MIFFKPISNNIGNYTIEICHHLLCITLLHLTKIKFRNVFVKKGDLLPRWTNHQNPDYFLN